MIFFDNSSLNPGAQLGVGGRWGRALPSAFHTVATDMSLNRGTTHIALGLRPRIISSCAPSQNYPVALLIGPINFLFFFRKAKLAKCHRENPRSFAGPPISHKTSSQGVRLFFFLQGEEINPLSISFAIIVIIVLS